MTARRMIGKTCIIRLEFFPVLKSEIVGLDLDSHFSKPLKLTLYFLLAGIHTLHHMEKDSWGKN